MRLEAAHSHTRRRGGYATHDRDRWYRSSVETDAPRSDPPGEVPPTEILRTGRRGDELVPREKESEDPPPKPAPPKRRDHFTPISRARRTMVAQNAADRSPSRASFLECSRASWSA